MRSRTPLPAWALAALVAGCSATNEHTEGKAPPTPPTSHAEPARSPVPATPAASPAAESPHKLRAPDELLRDVARARAAVESVSAQPPRADQPGFTTPPRERELAWINDRSIPLDRRLNQAMSLYDDSKVLMKRYAASDLAAARKDLSRAADGTESLLWAASVIRQFGHMSTALTTELIDTLSPSDPSYPARMAGVGKMRIGAEGMLRGALITLSARRSKLADRRRLTSAWNAHADDYTRLWQPSDCAGLAPAVKSVLDSETDSAIRRDLGVLSARLAACARRPASPAPPPPQSNK